VDETDWYSAYIGAVSDAKLMIGKPDGTFDPSADVTVEELLTVWGRALGLKVPESATVEGNVSEWSKGYVAAAIENGLIGKQQDYTVPVDLETLLTTTDNVNGQIVEKEGFRITNASQIGAKRVAVSLNGSPDPSNMEIAVVRISDRTSVGIESLEWSEKGYQVVAQLAEPLQDGTYEVSISGPETINPKRALFSFEAEAERVDKLEWGGADTLPHDDHVEVPFLVLNQFGEPMDAKDVRFTFFALGASIERIPDRSVVLVHLLAKAEPGDNVSLTILHTNPVVIGSKTYQVGESRVVSAIEIDGVPAAPLEPGQSAELIVRVYDQYGLLIKDAEWLNRELVAESGDIRLISVSPPASDGSGNIVIRATASRAVMEDATVNITVKSRSGAIVANAALAVKAAEASPAPVVTIPPGNPSNPANPSGNPTVTGGVYTIGSNFAFVTIETNDAAQIYYYYELEEASTDVYSASEVKNKALAKLQGGGVSVSADRASFTLLDLQFDKDYELFVVAADSSGNLSDVEIYEFKAGILSSYIELMNNGQDERCVIISDDKHWPNSDVYYALYDQPVHGTTAEIIDEIIQNGTKDDDGMFVFPVNGQVQYLYVVYHIGGNYELFSYASDDFPEGFV